MRLASYADSVVAWAPAKVNLFLEILGKRADGYHDLATAMLAVSLFDTLVCSPAPQGVLDLSCNRTDLDCGPGNLVIKAARLLQEETGCYRGASIRLVKRIPMQAGLGGGSADAAATLCTLNRLWNLRLETPRLLQLGARLGSDVSFFIQTDAGWCTGRGEQVTPLKLGRRLHLVLICPPFGCSTPAVYGGLTLPTTPRSGTTLCHGLEKGDIDAISSGLHNRLYASALTLAPRLADYLEKLRSLGAKGALMSGSGSSLFALGRDRKDARDIARAYAASPLDPNDGVFVVRSCSSPLPPS